MTTLYGSPNSVYANKVRYVLNALGLDYEFAQVNLLKGEHKSEEHIKRNPSGKVPVLEDGDLTIFESNAIIRYLGNVYGTKYYPQDPKQRARIDQWIDFVTLYVGDGTGTLMGNIVFAPVFGTEADESSIQLAREQLKRFLPIIDDQLAESRYLTGDQLTLADFNLLTALDPAELIGVDLSVYPNITKFRNELIAEPWYTKNYKSYSEFLREALGLTASV